MLEALFPNGKLVQKVTRVFVQGKEEPDSQRVTKISGNCDAE